MVNVTCVIKDDQIDGSQTVITLVFNDDTILEMTGEEALDYLYDTYLKK